MFKGRATLTISRVIYYRIVYVYHSHALVFMLYILSVCISLVECQLHLPNTDLISLQPHITFTTSLRTNKALRHEIMGPDRSWDPSQPLQQPQQTSQQQQSQ